MITRSGRPLEIRTLRSQDRDNMLAAVDRTSTNLSIAASLFAVIALRPNFGSPEGRFFRLVHVGGLAAPT